MFCKHEWKVLSETTTQSVFEMALSATKSASLEGEFKLPGQLCDGERKHIAIVACEKCGKLKRYVEAI